MYTRIILLMLASLLAACQSHERAEPPPKEAGQITLRGTLTRQQRQWILTTCTDNKHYLVDDRSAFISDAVALQRKSEKSLFLDASGDLESAASLKADGLFSVKTINRLTLSPEKGCHEQDFSKVVVRVIGKNPLWVTSVALKGLVLERVNQNPIVAPYVVERMPGGQMNFSTKANGNQISLWVAPERCVDEETGEVYSHTANLKVNYQVFNGCGYLGQASGMR